MNIIAIIPNRPGALINLLLAFALKGTNIEEFRTQSVVGRPGHCAFYLTAKANSHSSIHEVVDTDQLHAAALDWAVADEFPETITTTDDYKIIFFF